jgi:ABC-type lipoprotein export system ATPase subunit
MDDLKSSPYERERELMYQELMERRRVLNRHRAAAAHGHIAPAWADQLSESFPVLFITDQRLIIESPRQSSERNRSTRAAADEVARQIAQEMSAAKSAYGNRSQALDHDFPQRVIGTIKNPPNMTDQELRDQLEELTRKSAALEVVGLLAKESVSEFEDLDLALANVKSLIQTYIEDSRQKLAVLEPLRIKLQLFMEFLRQHYGHKRIIIDPEVGLMIVTGSRRPAPLPPRKLSSGEQQMMVLAHQILFKATEGTLVLIDEPELSLHVLWQSTFVEDLAEMGKVNNLSFLLATHSPTLIGGREDLKRSLDRLSRG